MTQQPYENNARIVTILYEARVLRTDGEVVCGEILEPVLLWHVVPSAPASTGRFA